ncbi:gp24.1 [Bacillus phage SPO1]|uniref:Gp24.1 n=2 Tax=Okubovirus TaxID=1857845 RepID=B6V2L1_BPSP1|nr:RusA-like Holliday junction resolvase [Bacillus phage SPO1]ACI91024.1 gp24.1 [Bacillus phage SPO1]APZ82356.1 hypothetical protein Goe2_c12000 [Bacillus phage vB_BsuM-Goe2]WCS68760.1 hypothetical protein Goe19_01190 [Bacillus phage vB_BsuM-Goe19]
MATKKKINSKAKGAEYERRIAKYLGAWWGESFHRTPQSGGLNWGTDSRVAGDITTPVDSKFPFTVECKKREGWDLDQVIKGTGQVEKWWTQCIGDSERVELRPFLIFAKNFNPDYCMLKYDDFISLARKRKENNFNYFIIHTVGVPYKRVVVSLDDFTKAFTPEDVLEALGVE